MQYEIYETANANEYELITKDNNNDNEVVSTDIITLEISNAISMSEELIGKLLELKPELAHYDPDIVIVN